MRIRRLGVAPGGLLDDERSRELGAGLGGRRVLVGQRRSRVGDSANRAALSVARICRIDRYWQAIAHARVRFEDPRGIRDWVWDV